MAKKSATKKKVPKKIQKHVSIRAAKKSVPKKTKIPTKKKPIKKVAKNAVKKVTKKVTKKTTPKKKMAKKKNVGKKTSTKHRPTNIITTRNKKNAQKSSMHKSIRVKKVLAPDEYFWVNYGPIIRDIHELATALKDMTEEQFTHHTKREEGVNDFAEWVRDVIGDDELAKKLVRVRSRQGARRLVVSRAPRHPRM